MSAPRIGSLGVGTTKGDLYVVNTGLELERVPVGTDNQILVADSANPLGVAWKDPTLATFADIQFNADLAIFKNIDLGGGAIANPSAASRGTHAVLGFNDTTINGIVWQNAMPKNYSAGAALSLSIYWVALTAILGDVIWAAAFERLVAGSSVLTDGFAALQTAPASTAPGVLGDIAVATIPFTSAQIDGIVAGNPLRLFIQRTASAGGDDMVGDAQLVRAVLNEV